MSKINRYKLAWKEVFIQHHTFYINENNGLYVKRKEIMQGKHGFLYMKRV